MTTRKEAESGRARGFAAVIACAALLAAGEASPARAQTTGPATRAAPAGEESVVLLGSPTDLYAVRVEQVGFGGQWQTSFYRRPVSTGRWAPVTQVVGRAVGMTLWRGQLVAQMEDGSWRSCFEGGSTPGLPLPDGVELVALAGEPATREGEPDRLTAVVRKASRSMAMDLQGGTWVPAGMLPEGALASSAIRVGGKVEVLAREGDETTLYEGAEQFDAAAPAGATRPATTRPATRPATRAVTTTWTPIGHLPATARSGTLVDVVGDVGIWVRDGNSTGKLYLRSAGLDPARAIDLGRERGSLGVAGGRLRVIYESAEAGEWMEQAYDVTGKKLGAPEPTSMVRGIGDERIWEVVQGLAVAGAMAGLLLAWKRRAELTPEAAKAIARQPIAPWHLRLASGTVDAIPWFAMGGYLWWSQDHALTNLTFGARDVYLILVAAATVSMHTLVGELMFGGRSIGKLLFGLRVVSLDGGAPRPGEILGRCLLKMSVLLQPAFWISVLISPVRQGVWDAATGTLVVRDGATPDDESKEDADER